MNFRSEKGSITVYVLVAMFFLLAVIAGRFVIANRNLKVQYDAISRIKGIYEDNDKVYSSGNTVISGGGSGGSTSTDMRPPIEIYNYEQLKFFMGESSEKRIYIYQTGIYYVLDAANKKDDSDILVLDSDDYKLMSDIYFDESYYSTYYRYSDIIGDTSNILHRDYNSTDGSGFNFNNHIIYFKIINSYNSYRNNPTKEYIFQDSNGTLQYSSYFY